MLYPRIHRHIGLRGERCFSGRALSGDSSIDIHEHGVHSCRGRRALLRQCDSWLLGKCDVGLGLRSLSLRGPESSFRGSPSISRGTRQTFVFTPGTRHSLITAGLGLGAVEAGDGCLSCNRGDSSWWRLHRVCLVISRVMSLEKVSAAQACLALADQSGRIAQGPGRGELTFVRKPAGTRCICGV